MQNNLDSAQSLALIIQSFTENSKGIETIIVDISKSIDNINKKVDVKNMKKNTASLKTIIGGVNSYITGMYEVISAISKPSNGIVFDNNFKKDILGIDAELSAQIAKGEIDGDSKYAENRIETTKNSSIPKQILAFSTVINELYKAFDKMGETVANPMHMAMFEIKMKFMQDNIQSMINLMIKSFTNINVGDAKKIINVLTAEPEKTKTIMENTTMQKSSSNVIKEGANLLQDSNNDSEAYMKNITETTKGRQGLIDVILGVINCFQLLNNLPMPNLLTFRIKLKLSMKQLNLLYSDISKFASSNSFDVKLVQSMNKSFEAIVETFLSLKQIIENIAPLGTLKNMISSKLAAKSINIIFGLNEDSKNQSILVIVSKAINSSYFKDFTNKSTQEQLNTFKLNINIIKSISISISTIGFLIVPLLLAQIALKLLVNSVQIIVKTFDKDTLKQLKDTEKSITEFSKLLLLLSASVLVFVLTGILVKESISSIFYVALYCVLVIGIFYLMTRLIKMLKEINIEKEILYLSGVILSISMTVMLLALTGQLIKEEWKNFSIVALFFGTVVLSFIALALAVKLLKELEVTQSILYIAGAVFILSLTAMMLALTSRFIIAEWKNFGIVSLFLVGLIGAAMLLALTTRWIKEAGKSLLYISLSVGILVLIMYLLVPISYLVNENWDNLLMTFALLGALVVAVIGVAYAAKLIEKGTKPLILIAITMIILSSTILILNEAGKNLSWEAFGMFAAIVGLLSALAIGLGYPAVSVLAKAGAITLIMLGAAFMTFAISLKIIVDSIKTMNDLNIDPEKDTDKIKAPIEVLFGVLSYANGLDKKIIRNGKRRLRDLSKSMSYISNIAEVLQKIASLNLPTKFDNTGKPMGFRSMDKNDFIVAAQNAIGMVRIVASLFGDKEEPVNILGTQISITPITEDDLKLITNKSKRKIRQLSKITSFIGDIAETIQNIASLKVPKAFDEQGRPTGYIHMEEKHFKSAAENAALIATTLIGAITAPEISNKIDDMGRSTIKKTKYILEAIGSLDSIVYVIQQMVQMSVPTEYDSEGKPTAFRVITKEEREIAIQNTITLMTELLKAITSDDITSALDNMGRKAHKNLEMVMSSCGGVKNLIDTIKNAATFDQKTIADGIGNVKESILRYVGIINDLFVDKWGWKTKQITLFGRIKINIPVYQIVDKAEIDMDRLKSAVDKMNEIAETINPLKSLVDSISALGKSEEATVAIKGIDVLKNIVVGYTQIFTGDDKGKGGVNISDIGEKKFARFKELVEYNDYFSNIQTKDLTANTDQFVRFIDKANSIDTEKIKTVRDMFEQMTEFSKSVRGDFSRLADVLSDKLVVVLEKLQETISGIPTNVSVSQNTIGQNNFTNTLIPSTQTKQQTQVNTVQPQNNDKINKNLVDIKDSIDDMIALLTSVKNNTENYRGY